MGTHEGAPDPITLEALMIKSQELHEAALELMQQQQAAASKLLDAINTNTAAIQALVESRTNQQPEEELTYVVGEEDPVEPPVEPPIESGEDDYVPTTHNENNNPTDIHLHVDARGNNEGNRPNRFRRGLVIGAAAVAGAVGLFWLGGHLEKNSGENRADGASDAPQVAKESTPIAGAIDETQETTTSSEVEAGSWKEKPLQPNDQSRFKEDGSEKIKNAETRAEAEEAFGEWVEVIRGDKKVFAAIYKEAMGEDIDRDKLFDKNGNPTKYFESKYNKFLESVDKVNPDKAGKYCYNTGLNQEGEVVKSPTPGISGDRKAIKVTMIIDGEENIFWILGRCIQPCYPDKPGLPPGKTDEPPKKTPPKKPPTPEQPTPKTPRPAPGPGNGNENQPKPKGPATPDKGQDNPVGGPTKPKPEKGNPQEGVIDAGGNTGPGTPGKPQAPAG